MNIRVTGAFRIQKTNEDYQKIRDDLTFRNPFEPDKEFKAYFETSGELIIPRGYPGITGYFENLTVDKYADIEVSDSFQLRDYQEEAVSSIYNYLMLNDVGQCLFSAPTGSGKSYSLSGLLAKFKKKTLILSHLTMLGDQMANEISTNLSEGSVGILSAKSIGKPLPDIAISSFQLLDSNLELLAYIKEEYSIVAIDEGENGVTKSRLKVIFKLRPKYIIVITATPTRELMQQTDAVNYISGDFKVFMEQPEESRIHSKHIMIDYRPLLWNSPANTNMYKVSLGKFIMKSRILKDIADFCFFLKQSTLQGVVWVVIDLNAVQDKLEELLVARGLSVGIIRGTTSAKKRKEILLGIANGTIDVILGSAPLSAGISMPEVSFGIRLMPNSSSEELLEQQRGRLNRWALFKDYQFPIWLDFIIDGALLYGAKARHKIYGKTTHKVITIKPEALQQTILKEAVKA